MANAVPNPPSPDMFNQGAQNLSQGMAPPVAASQLQPPANQPSGIPDIIKKYMQQQQQKEQTQQQVLQSPEAQSAIQTAFAPEAPMPQVPVQEYKSSLNAFKDLLPALAILGGSFTKAPLQSAISAATGAMEGFNQGQQAQAEEKMKEFNASLAEWKTKHDQIREMRGDIVDKNGNVNYANLAAYASAHGNAALLAALQADPATAAKMYMDYEKNVSEIDKLHADTSKALAEAYKVRRIQSYGGKKGLESILADPSSSDEDKSFARKALKDIKDVETSDVFGSPVKMALRAWIQQQKDSGQEPSADEIADKMIEINSKNAMETASARRIGTQGTTIELSSNLLNNSLPILEDSFKAVDSDKWSDWNSFQNYFKKHSNDPKLEALNENILNTESDLALLIRRGGVATVDSQNRAHQIINNMMNTKSFESFKSQVEKESQAAVAAEQKTRQSILGQNGSKSNSPPPEAVNALKNGQGTKEQFDEIFGAGAADRVLNGR